MAILEDMPGARSPASCEVRAVLLPDTGRTPHRLCCSEAENIRRGKPTLRPWEEVRDKAFGEEGEALRPESGSGLTAAAGAEELAAAAGTPA